MKFHTFATILSGYRLIILFRSPCKQVLLQKTLNMMLRINIFSYHRGRRKYGYAHRAAPLTNQSWQEPLYKVRIHSLLSRSVDSIMWSSSASFVVRCLNFLGGALVMVFTAPYSSKLSFLNYGCITSTLTI